MGKRIEVSKEVEWLTKMVPALKWVIIPPDLWGPYSPILPTFILEELAFNRDSFLNTLEVQCMCDGYEVLRVKNLRDPVILSDHPCLTSLHYEELQEFWNANSITRMIDLEVKRMQELLREELDSRDVKYRERVALEKIPDKKKNITEASSSQAARIVKK